MTPKQRKALTFITGHIAEHGHAPSLSEIGSAMGGLSKTSTHALVSRLAELGHIVRREGRSRGLDLPDRRVLSGYAAEELAAELRARGWSAWAPKALAEPAHG